MTDKHWNIGGVELDGPFVLAPLAGISDVAMREICAEQGAALTYTEMVSAKGLHYGDKKTEDLLYIPEGSGKTAIQIFGSEPDIIREAAAKLNDRPNVILDINMGCPVPKVVKNGDGSALMKNPDKVYDVVSAACAGTSKPVTVKIRKGFDDDHINAVEVAKAAQAAGASAVAVHGRTREQYYSGSADWDIIRQVKEAVGITVIGNGDVRSGQDALRMMDQTGCDLVMVARAALGNPWIFTDLNRALDGLPPQDPPTREEKSAMMLRQFNRILELKGEYRAVREMRKHIAWYVKGMKNAAKIRGSVNSIEKAEEMREVLKLDF